MLLWGPASILSVITLALSYKKSVIAELIVPVELISLFFMFLVINFTGIFEDKNNNFRMWNLIFVLITYFVLCMFITASWLFCFLIRGPIIIILVITHTTIQIMKRDNFVYGQSMMSLFLFILVNELAIYLNVKAQLHLFQKIKTVEL